MSDDNISIPIIIKDTMFTDYVSSNILSKEVLDNEINSWIDYI